MGSLIQWDQGFMREKTRRKGVKPPENESQGGQVGGLVLSRIDWGSPVSGWAWLSAPIALTVLRQIRMFFKVQFHFLLKVNY